ncbi:MAG: hypothetical protein IPM29_30025 [Planctomycetes bacterium]|nr:hypothetical protein [Planctomycetota bacterium]
MSTPPGGPGARTNHALAFDIARSRFVLFGGYSNATRTRLSDTWTFDPATRAWTTVNPSTSPSARLDHRMVGEIARSRVLLFGGNTPTGRSAETWSWDGASWTLQSPATSPPPTESHAMAYSTSSGRVLLFGGWTPAGRSNRTWEWRGTSWFDVTPTVTPPDIFGRVDLQMVFDPDPAAGGFLLFGGNQGGPTNDTWQWNGTRWIARQVAPGARLVPVMVTDPARGEILVHGGDTGNVAGDTWRLRNGVYSRLTPPTPGPMVQSAAAAFDGNDVVVFGGWTPAGRSNQTWTWNGATWTQRTNVGTPPVARTAAAAATDASGQGMVLFGGDRANNPAATWQWNGSTWQATTPSPMPSIRDSAAMARDPLRSRVVLFGGRDTATGAALSDTWEWDGATWTRRMPTTNPPARLGHAMVHDPRRGIVVMTGGMNGTTWFNDVWEWDGIEWRQQTVVPGLPERGFQGFAFDPASARLVQLGGRDRFVGLYGETWATLAPAPAPVQLFGAACGGLSLDSSPFWIGGQTTIVSRGHRPFEIVVLLFGVDRTSWGGASLPFDLAALRAPGCFLNIAPLSPTLSTLANSADVTLMLNIPPSCLLLGSTMFLQSVERRVGANPLGIVTSNGVAGTFGAR